MILKLVGIEDLLRSTWKRKIAEPLAWLATRCLFQIDVQGEEYVSELMRASKLPFVLAPNTSVGINLLAARIGETAKVLGSEFQVTITETHHIHKKDQPSGTALQLARAIAVGLGVGPEKIPIESIREGEVVGIHRVTFESLGETLEFSHQAKSRDTFALGALRAARWIVGKPNGLYSMADVLGL